MVLGFTSVRPTLNRHLLLSTSLFANTPKSEPSTTNEGPKKGINMANLLQLVLMGAGAPGLGEFDRMDENGKMFFKLEANNFVDSKVIIILEEDNDSIVL